MDHFRNFDHSSVNGLARSVDDAALDRRKRNYKLVLDPTLKPGSQKVYRFDGSLPGETTPLIVHDPRSRMKRFWTRREPALLPVPKFKYDEYYVGLILPKEVTFCRLNDNINQNFLFDMCKSFGNVEECNIYYHPKTKKHLGLGRVLFTSTRAARQCCEKLDNTSKMGKIMTVIVDSMGAERDRMYKDLIADKPVPRPVSPKTPQAKDPRHKLPDRPPSLEMPVAVDRPVTADRSASSDHSGFWTPGSGSTASSDRGYGSSSLPYPDNVGGYSTTPSEVGFAAAGQADMSYPPSTPRTPHTPQVGFIDNNMLQMTPPVTGYDAGMTGEGIMFNADSFQHPPPQFDAQNFESQPHNFDRSYKQQQQPHRSGYGQYDQPFQRKDRGRDRRDSRWEWTDHRDRQRRERQRGGKDRGRYHSHHKGGDGDREHRDRDRHRGEWNRNRGKDWNNGRSRDWENGREWDSGGGRQGGWENECNSRDNSWNKDVNEQQYPPPLPQQPQLQQPQLQQPPAPLPPSVPLLPPTHIPPPQSPMLPPLATVAPPLPDITMAPPPLPQPTVVPEVDSRRGTSLEARIQSLLRQNSDFDDGSSDTNQPVPPDDDAPPLPPPPMTEDVVPPPLPPEPEESAPPLPEESAPPLPADGDGEGVCDIPSNGILSTGEMLSTFHTWATSDFVQEESVEVGADRTPVSATDINVTEVTSADIADAAQKTDIIVDDDDGDDHMSLSSLSSGEEKLEVTAPPPPGVMQQHQQLPGGALFASPTLLPTWGLDNKLQMQNMYMATMPPMQGVSFLDSPMVVNHEYEEEQMFSGVLEKVIAELRVIMMKDLSKKMVETSAFKSFEGWWDGEKNRQKKVIPNATEKVTVAKATTAPMAKMSDLDSISTLFDNQSKGLARAFGVGGLLGLRGAVPKLPSFRRKFRPPSPPPPDEKFRGPRTPDGSDNDDVSDVESLPAKGKIKKALLDDTDKSDSDSDDEEDEEEDSSSGISEEEEEDSEEESSADEEEADEDEDVEMQSDKDDSEAEEDSARAGTSLKLQEQDKHKLENGDVTTTNEDVMSEDSRSCLSPILEVEDRKTSKKTSSEKTTSIEAVSEKSPDVTKNIEKPPVDSNNVSRDGTAKDRERPMLPPAGDMMIAESAKDSIEQFAEVDVCDDRTSVLSSIDSGLEKDVAMTLLQMHEVVSEPVVTPPKTEEPSHYTMTAEHNYFAPPKSGENDKAMQPSSKTEPKETDLTDSASEGEPNLIPCLPPSIQADHNYCRPYYPVEEAIVPTKKRARKRTASTSSNILVLPDNDNSVVKLVDSSIPEAMEFVEVKDTKTPKKKTTKSKAHSRKLADVTNLSRGNRELASLLPTIVEKPSFNPRPMQQEMAITYEFLFKGIDQEDVAYLQQRYEELLQDDSMQTYWLHDTHWVEHTHTLIPNPQPPKKKRRHMADIATTTHNTGAARTEGYYKISHTEKSGYLRHARGVQESQNADSDGPRLVFDPEVVKKKAEKSREARSESRRWQNVLSSMGEDCGDLLKFNQLKFRKKSLHFCRSGIHDWGLFALEPIAADEMVVEYVGQVIRQTVADQRERRYEAMGLGSSYLFRIDHDTIIDATKDGNMARFINHSCNPNCYAKIINVDALKKIVIYSRREIKVNEEVTYDYKFPIEDKKIPCFCGAPGCRGSLN